MKNYLLASLLAGTLAACGTTPNPRLDEARTNYESARNNPQVTSLAATELNQAGTALNAASDAWNKREDSELVDHLAYLAKQKVAIAQEAAKQRTAEASVENASTERDRVRLEARTREAAAAQRSAQTAQQQAQTSQQQAQASQQQAQEAEARARELEAQLKDLEARKTERGMVITLGDVLFDTNQAQLKSGSMRNVQKLADFLKQHPERKAMIEGFTDSSGSDSHNQALSERRANAVRMALIDMGVSPDQLTSRGYGEAFPVASNNSAGSRQLNRRVEIVLSDESGNIRPR